MIVDRDRAKYEELAAVDEYRSFSPGEHYAPVFCELVGESRGTVLDAGCCTGKGGLALSAKGFDVTLCDYTDANLDHCAKSLPFGKARTLWDEWELFYAQSFDYVYCCDVLEHIPREFTMLTVRNLCAVAERGVFFSVGLTPDRFGIWVGKPLHETVESFVWWRDRLSEFGRLVDARDFGSTGLYYLEPR